MIVVRNGAKRNVVLLASLALCGCVVDEQRTEELRKERAAAAPALPSDPVARPVLGGTTASRVAVTIESLGTVSYDGLSVPMVSPDGRFIAAQGSPAPSREQRLAIRSQGTAESFSGSTVSISRLASGVSGLGPVAEFFDLKASIILGRDTSAEGVLVESPRDDGSRWIGIAQWPAEGAVGATQVRWLVRERAVSAHAVFAEGGGLLYCRRPIDSERFGLVLRSRDGQRRTLSLPDASLVFPLMAPDLRHATCLAVADSGAISLLLIDLSLGSDDALGRVVRRFDLASSGGIDGASQIVAASQSAVHGLAQRDALSETGPSPSEPLLGPIFFHPAMDRCAAIDAARRSLVALAPKSVAAVDAGDGRALCSTPDGLVLWTPGPQAGRGTSTRVLSEDYLPRRTASGERPFVLLAPTRRSPTDLRLFGMAPAPAER